MKIKGFTLIELLIVIAILGILVALILPRFADVRQDANTKVCVANLRGLASAMSTYETKENKGLTWGGANNAAALVTWEYIASEPFCPYETGASPTSYTLVTGSPDNATCPNYGVAGKDDDSEHKWP